MRCIYKEVYCIAVHADDLDIVLYVCMIVFSEIWGKAQLLHWMPTQPGVDKQHHPIFGQQGCVGKTMLESPPSWEVIHLPAYFDRKWIRKDPRMRNVRMTVASVPQKHIRVELYAGWYWKRYVSQMPTRFSFFVDSFRAPGSSLFLCFGAFLLTMMKKEVKAVCQQLLCIFLTVGGSP